MTVSVGSSPPAALLPLYRKDGTISAWVTIDADAVAWASQWRWRLSTKGYAVRTHRAPSGKIETRLLHREVLGLKSDGPPRVRLLNGKLDVRRSSLSFSSRWILSATRADPRLAGALQQQARHKC